MDCQCQCQEFAEVLKVYVMPKSPPSFIMILFLVTIIVLSFMGMETIVRFAKFIIYILGAGYILVVLLSSQNFAPRHLFPLLGYGLTTIIHGLLRSSFYGDIVIWSNSIIIRDTRKSKGLDFLHY